MDTITVIVNSIEYDISSIVEYDDVISEDISKELDTASFRIPITLADTITNGANTLDLSMPLKPLTKVEWLVGEETKRFYVREDLCDTISYATPNEYMHQVSLIEPTKLLELKTIPDLAITQPRGEVSYATSALNLDDDERVNTVYYSTDAVPLGTIGSPSTTITLLNTTAPTNTTFIDGLTLKDAGRTYEINIDLELGGQIILTHALWNVSIWVNGVKQLEEEYEYNTTFIKLGKIIHRQVSLSYTSTIANEVVELRIYGDSSGGRDVLQARTYITTKIEVSESPITYFDEVIDKMLISYKVADMNNSSFAMEFTLADNTRNKISNFVAPELTFSTYTIWEGIEELADILKAIPRLSKDTWNEITFDFIDELNKGEWTNPHEISERQELRLDKYSNAIEINADNVIESIESQAVIVEPYIDGWMTLRSDTEGPNQLTDTTLGLKVRSDIYQTKTVLAKGFSVTFTDATTDTTSEWDISSYVVEEKKWKALLNLAYESARTTVNLGKGNTLYYSKSNRRLVNFGYRAPKPTSISLALDQVIYQIIAAVATQVTGKTVSTVNNQDLDHLILTQYRVSYSSFKKIRAKVYKHNARDFEIDATLYSNERARVNDNVKLGKTAQSLANRTGNRTRLISGLTLNADDLPVIGNVVDGVDIVTKTNIISENDIYEFTATVFKDYSEISSFVGIQSEYRQWQVPDTEVVERILKYEDAITVSRTLGTKTHSVMTIQGFVHIVNPFISATPVPITYHKFSTRETAKVPADTDWETFDTVSEGPVDIVALGTTTILNITVKDNYNIDDTLEGWEDNGGTFEKWYQNNRNYTNTFGQIDSARYEIFTTGKTDNSVDDGNLYPEYSQAEDGIKISSIDIKVKKDAREATFYTWQLNFFSKMETTEDIRVYNGISKFNGFAIQDLDSDIVAVLLKDGYFPSVEEINISPTKYKETTFTGNVSLASSDSHAQIDYHVAVLQTTNAELFTGWGLIDKLTGELIFTTVVDIQSSDTADITFDDFIYLYTDETKGL